MCGGVCSYLVSPSFPLIVVVAAVYLVTNLPGVSGFKAQMVDPLGAVGATGSSCWVQWGCSKMRTPLSLVNLKQTLFQKPDSKKSRSKLNKNKIK